MQASAPINNDGLIKKKKKRKQRKRRSVTFRGVFSWRIKHVGNGNNRHLQQIVDLMPHGTCRTHNLLIAKAGILLFFLFFYSPETHICVNKKKHCPTFT